jgi:hypothetical protein
MVKRMCEYFELILFLAIKIGKDRI